MVNSMRLNADISWDRYALIVEIIERFHKANFRLGKTALQKMIYLLQKSFGVDCDYSYTLYTYGPYSSDVARDLDVVAGFGGAEMNYDFSFAGYEIRPGSASSELRSRGEAFLADIGPKLDQLVADFGGFTAKDLELRSTIVYLSDAGQPRADLINRVHEVKPHFSSTQIEGAITELEKKGYVGQAATTNSVN
jgi:uncharacterized protein YwgA